LCAATNKIVARRGGKTPPRMEEGSRPSGPGLYFAGKIFSIATLPAHERRDRVPSL